MVSRAPSESSTRRTCTIRELREARAWLERPSGRFRDDAELLRAAQWLFELVIIGASDARPPDRLAAQRLLPRLRVRLRENLARAPRRPAALVTAIRQHKLEPLDQELLLLVTLVSLGLRFGGLAGADIEDLSQILISGGHHPLEVGRAFQPSAPLLRCGLIRVGEGERWVLSSVSLAPHLQRVLCRPGGDEPWQVASYAEFLERLAELVYVMEEQDNSGDGLDIPERILLLLAQARATLAAHPNWPLASAIGDLTDRERLVLLALAAKDLGHLPCSSDLFTGRGLAYGMGATRRTTTRMMSLFAESAPLRRREWIRPIAARGDGGVQRPGEHALAEASWELTDTARAQFSIPLRRHLATGGLRAACVRMNQLILHEEAREALTLALAQARNPSQLFDEWGLGKVVGYGRGATLLFAGPPGVGKTAAAEALAHELGRPLLEADASRLLNCWVGETEKNLARVFCEAAQTGAVLFFDEADALFYDRAHAQHTWEVSHVNVLLREIERFEGVCVLATNRRDGFDPALERRLTLRVDFRPPTAEMAAQIWRLLLPEKLPLAADVDFAALGRLGLNGGQIKNAVLNAARRALANGVSEVSMPMLLNAAQGESAARAARIGFTCDQEGRAAAIAIAARRNG